MGDIKFRVEEKFDRTCKTNLGRIDLSELEAGGSKLKLTRIQMGKGLVNPSTDIQEFTKLVDPVQYNDINSANTLVQYQTTIAFRVRGSDIVETFKWSELGIFARLNDGEEFLIAYAYSSNPDILVKGSKVTDQYVFGIRFENSEKVTVKLHVDQTIPLHADTHLSDGIDPIPTVTSVRDGLVPVGPNDSKLVLVASDPPHWRPVPLTDRNNIGGIPPLDGQAKSYLAGNGRWYRTTPFLVRDTTLYVDPAYSDIWPKFSTLAKALEYLSGENISAGVTVTIELADGVHKIEDTIKFDHPQAQQVRIIEASPSQRIVYTEIKEDGDDLILKVESIRGLSVGMSVITQVEGTNSFGIHPGGHTIKHIEAHYVRMTRSRLYAPSGSGEYKELTGHLYFYKSKLDCAKGGLDLPDGLGPPSRFYVRGSSVFEGNDKYNGILSEGRSSFSGVIVSGFLRGIFAHKGHTGLGFVAAHDCMDGVVGNIASSGNLYCNGNTGAGLWAYQHNMQIGNYIPNKSNTNAPYTFLKGNRVGLISDEGSHVTTARIHSQANRVGLMAVYRGSITFGKGGNPSYINGNQLDIAAYDGGFIRGYLSGGTVGNCSPQSGTVGNLQSYILITQ